MKRADLRAGVEYAMSSSRNPTYPVRVKLIDAEKLYFRPRFPQDGPTFLPSRATRYEAGTWNTPRSGLLVQRYNAKAQDYVNEEDRVLVAPQHLISTWEDWLVRRAEIEAKQKADSLARIELYTRNEANAARANTLLTAKGISGVHVSKYSSTASIPVSLLIQLLEATDA
jgi:hypothetical protein